MKQASAENTLTNMGFLGRTLSVIASVLVIAGVVVAQAKNSPSVNPPSSSELRDEGKASPNLTAKQGTRPVIEINVDGNAGIVTGTYSSDCKNVPKENADIKISVGSAKSATATSCGK